MLSLAQFASTVLAVIITFYIYFNKLIIFQFKLKIPRPLGVRVRVPPSAPFYQLSCRLNYLGIVRCRRQIALGH